MFTKLTVPPASTNTPTPNRDERKSPICNHPDRATIAFLIDTAAIRNAPNSFRTNETFISNRHKTGPFYVPHHGAIRQSAQFHDSRFTNHGSRITSHGSRLQRVISLKGPHRRVKRHRAIDFRDLPDVPQIMRGPGIQHVADRDFSRLAVLPGA